MSSLFARRLLFSLLFITAGYWGLRDLRDNTLRLAEGIQQTSTTQVVQASVELPIVPERATASAGSRSTEPLDLAKQFLELNREEWQLQAHHDFKPQIQKNPLGTYVKFDVYQGEFPITGMSIEIFVDRRGRPRLSEKQYMPVAVVDVEGADLLGKETIVALLPADLKVGPEAIARANRVLFLESEGQAAAVGFVFSARETRAVSREVQVLIRADNGTVVQREYSRAEVVH